MKKMLLMAILVAAAVFSVTHHSDAGPLVIRDARITDIAMTPALGRGYTIATNTYQSMCMENVVTTEPSYDFQYTFESIEKDSTDKKQVVTKNKVDYTNSVVKAMVQANADIATTKEEHTHSIKVELNMDTYYASVDEAKTQLSGPAKNLLTNKDIPGFFHACGSNYIRSLGRNAKFLSIITYTSKSDKRDATFEANLKFELRGLAKAIYGGLKVESENKITSNTSKEERKMIINTRAWGLGKNEGATLISYDIPTFKAAVKDAFISMQNPMTGKITTMEVVPWVEFTGFQDAVVLEEVEGKEAEGKIPNYRKKDTLNQNAEFLGEIEKADRNGINNYFTAKICKETINANYKQNDKFIEGFQNAKLMNNRTGQTADMTIDKLDKILTTEYIDSLLKNREDFMYGEKGAEKCIDKMFGEDMFRKKWGQFPECVGIRKNFVSVISTDVLDYCMPTISPEN